MHIKCHYLSGLIAEIFLQHFGQHIIKNTLENKNISYYNRYVCDILIIYDTNHTKVNEIQNFMNKIHTELQFKATDKNNNTISFLDLLITRETTKLSINIYRKPATTDTTIHLNQTSLYNIKWQHIDIC
jgi:hypothetical protein